MAKIIPFEYFEPVLEHSVSNMKRIKKELRLAEDIASIDYVGLTILNITKLNDDFIKTLGGVLRDSDIVSVKNNLVYLFLPGTDFEGSMNIINDFKEFYEDVFDYIVSATLLKDLNSIKDILAELDKLALNKGWKV
ncbi:MAG: hypothetical protein M1276_06155 [Deltaproteobacteria bacterium]|jgi:hypothetical protein|nr:hypothetical protein [Deltaproteobacteria bacterium]